MNALPTSGFDPSDPIFLAHEGGKTEVRATKQLENARDLSLLYTPGVAEVSLAVAADPSLAKRYTTRGNTVAVISDGTAVLGLGDIGPLGALPVMEGKAVLFKHFAGVDAVPIVLETGSVEEIVETVARLAPTFGGINLEDIAAPRCFEIERRLKERLDIPVFHDDQHGTAIVVLAAVTNAAKVIGRETASLRIVVSGAGAAGYAVTNILRQSGIVDVVVVDSRGIIQGDRTDLTEHKRHLAENTNPRDLRGDLGVALTDADVFVGVSGGVVPEEFLTRMGPQPVILALANPNPEVPPHIARKYAAVIATGRSDFPNQINNVLAFPGIFRGALDSGAHQITEAMKLAAAEAIASLVAEPRADYIIPSVFDERVAPAMAAAVAALAGSADLTE